MSLHEAASQRRLVGKCRRDAALSSQAWDGVQAHGLRENQGLVLNPGYNRLWENSADSVYQPPVFCFSERKKLGYFLILKVAPACYIRK